MKLFLTGATGFVAKHIAAQALEGGHSVTASLRNLDRAEEVRKAVAPQLSRPEALDRLDFVALDLTRDEGWNEALRGHEALIHTASPFPLSQPRNPDEVIIPAREGTGRALGAAAAGGVKRVVLTSSCVAVWESLPPGKRATEDDWTDGDDPALSPYARSKTLAERLAWEMADAQGLALTTINPSLILGPPLDRHYGASIGLVRRLMSGKDPMVPPIGMGCVDVRDVAAMHLAALERPDTAGNRFIANGGSLWFVDMAKALKQAWPERRIATRVAPAWMIRVMGMFDADLRSIRGSLGTIREASNEKATRAMGLTFRTPQEALLASARALVEMGEV